MSHKKRLINEAQSFSGTHKHTQKHQDSGNPSEKSFDFKFPFLSAEPRSGKGANGIFLCQLGKPARHSLILTGAMAKNSEVENPDAKHEFIPPPSAKAKLTQKHKTNVFLRSSTSGERLRPLAEGDEAILCERGPDPSPETVSLNGASVNDQFPRVFIGKKTSK